MCRWLAYTGSPVSVGAFLLEPQHSLIDQSLHAQMGTQTTNGDGFGLGWYDDAGEPALYHSVTPAWNDRNLRELATHVRSSQFLAHVRASTGTAVQQTNCHPFRYGRWLWMHNGQIRGITSIKRELAMAVDPALFAAIEGSTDSELMFYLSLSLGLGDDPVAAVERMAGLVEHTAEASGIDNSLNMSLATSNGEQLWIFRYSTAGRSPSLFYSEDVRSLRALYPDNPRLQEISEETRLIVSEPLSDLAGVWSEIPEASCGVIQAGQIELGSFQPRH